MFVVPSPKKAMVTAPVPRCCALSAAPVAKGRCAPTIANEPSAPTEKSVRCIEPPFPPQRPSALPRISAIDRSSGAPIASTAPWPRYVHVIVSPTRSAEHAPTETASCPWQRWVLPRTRLSIKRRITSSSKTRISSIRRWRTRRTVRSHGYWCDSAETHAVGASEEGAEARALLLDVLEEARTMLVPGARGSSVFEHVHTRIVEALPEGELPHHGGHGLGLGPFEDT